MSATDTDVTVLGLGAMGSALARAFLAAGHPTTVWNRTETRSRPLADMGASVADDPHSAVRGADIVVSSLVDGAAATAVLTAAAPGLAGKTVVELTSVTPRQAIDITRLVREAGAAALSGAVMVPPPMIGTEDAVVLYDGDRPTFDCWAETLRAIAPTEVFVSEAPGSAALLDIGMLDVFYGAVTSFVHAAVLVGAGGLAPADFLEHGSSMLALADVVARELAPQLAAGTFPGDENDLDMMLRGIRHVVETAVERGVDPALPKITERLMAEAVEEGHGDDGYGRIAELLRR